MPRDQANFNPILKTMLSEKAKGLPDDEREYLLGLMEEVQWAENQLLDIVTEALGALKENVYGESSD